MLDTMETDSATALIGYAKREDARAVSRSHPIKCEDSHPNLVTLRQQEAKLFTTMIITTHHTKAGNAQRGLAHTGLVACGICNLPWPAQANSDDPIV